MVATLTDLYMFFLIILKYMPGNTLKQVMTCSSNIHPKKLIHHDFIYHTILPNLKTLMAY
jgi:hypothetical protein